MQWKHKVGLAILVGSLSAAVSLACAQPWAQASLPGVPGQSLAVGPVQALAASANGQTLVAATLMSDLTYGGFRPGPIFLSTDHGVSWNLSSAPFEYYWSSVACSADGTVFVAATSAVYENCWCLGPPVFPGLIYVSTNSGAAWMLTSAPSNNWTCVVVRADGKEMFAAAGATDPRLNDDGFGLSPIYSSTNCGMNWTTTGAPSDNWVSLAVSADGTKLAAVAGGYWSGTNLVGGAVYTSVDSGATWTQTSAPRNCWSSVASSADGTKLVAAAITNGPSPVLLGPGSPHGGDGLIYLSDDSGRTWRPTNLASNEWISIVASADGTRLAAGSSSYDERGEFLDGGIYLSIDSGATWRATGTPRMDNAKPLAMSADGYRIVSANVAMIYGNPSMIYSLPYFGPWRVGEAPRYLWGNVVSSTNGSNLLAFGWDPGNGVSVTARSTDSGATWLPTSAPSIGGLCVAASADATTVVAVPVAGSGIYISTNSGGSWALTAAPSNYWSSVAVSGDGTKLVAAFPFPRTPNSFGGGLVYVSHNAGATWTRTSAPTNYWTTVISSADGIKLLAVSATFNNGDGLTYISHDSGQTWVPTSTPTNFGSTPAMIASSADASRLFAVLNGHIYLSGDAGLNWNLANTPTNVPTLWSSISCSTDGATVAALASGVYLSTDSGVTWARADTPAGNFQTAAVSAEGRVVAVGDGLICTLQSPVPAPPAPPSPLLSIGLSGGNPVLSWLIPSTDFVLQQESDLNRTNWIDVANQPTLNRTNLQNELTLLPPRGTAFYRLKRQ